MKLGIAALLLVAGSVLLLLYGNEAMGDGGLLRALPCLASIVPLGAGIALFTQRGGARRAAMVFALIWLIGPVFDVMTIHALDTSQLFVEFFPYTVAVGVVIVEALCFSGRDEVLETREPSA